MSEVNMSEVIVSKGIAALRLSNNKPEKVVVDGETFFFKRLTIDEESKVNGIILSFQDSELPLSERFLIHKSKSM